VEGTRSIIRYSRIGRRVPLHTSAAGKALIAWLPAHKCRELLAGYHYQQLTSYSYQSEAELLETLEKTTKTVDGLVSNESSKIASIMSNLESISTNFKTNNSKINNVMNNLDKVSDDFAKANFTQTIADANKSIAELQSILSKVNSGNGTLSLLIKDDNFYNNLNNAAINLDKLMLDLKENPKRYVSFSVFGSKKK
jgi:phospholipid/cholesterol/gamma-HCH transport system substrate-binding protein